MLVRIQNLDLIYLRKVTKMALNTLIDNDLSSSMHDANILVYIHKFYRLSQSFQKRGLLFFNPTSDDHELELIYQVVSQILEEIDNIDTSKTEIFELHTVLNHFKTLSFSKKTVIQNAVLLQQNNIVAHRELIEALIMLLVLLQLDEHNLKSAHIYLERKKK